MKANGKRILSILLALCLTAGLLAIMPVIASAADWSYDINSADFVADIEVDIQAILDDDAASGDTVTITGSKTDVDGGIVLEIPAGVTVVWKAVWECVVTAVDELITLSGDGSFEIAEDADILTPGKVAVYMPDGGAVDITVSGGSVETTAQVSAFAIDSVGNVKVSGGDVASDGTAIRAETVTVSGGKVYSSGWFGINAFGAVLISGGEVETDGSGLTLATEEDIAVYSATAVTLTGTGKVKADAIGIKAEAIPVPAFAADTVTIVSYSVSAGNITVSGGSVEANTMAVQGFGRDVVVSGGVVTGAAEAVHAHTVTDTATNGTVFTFGGNATVSGDASIEATAGKAVVAVRNANIAGGDVVATGTGVEAATVTVSDGSVLSSAGTAVSASGAVNVTGGAVEATVGTAIVSTNGNVAVSGTGEVTGATVAILATNGNITLSAGEVISDGIGLEAKNVTVSGGSVTADIGINLSSGGTVLVIGGVVEGDTYAIQLANFSVAAVLEDTCVGDYNVISNQGIIVEVEYGYEDDILPASVDSSTNGLTVGAGLNTAGWDCAGTTALIKLTLSDSSVKNIPWGKIVLPVISNGTQDRTSETAVTIGFKANVAGTVYIVHTTDTAGAPTLAQIKLGTSKVVTPDANGLVDLEIVTLVPGARNVYLVLVDPVNHTSNILKIWVPVYEEKFAVTVNNGATAYAKYAAGYNVTIIANAAPAGMVFNGWTTTTSEVIFDDANAKTTFFVMPNTEVEVTANFIEVPPVLRYVRLFGFNTKYVSNHWNWAKFILFFGWIWMWFIPPC